MPAFIDGRPLTDGEFVCVINGLTYVGRAQDWNYIQQSDQRLPTVTLNGVITDQQRNEPPAGPRGRLTVQILPWSNLPFVGDRDTLYVVTTGEDDTGRRLFDEAAYVYRPANREGPDPEPYKATNVSAAVVARLYDSGDQLPSQAALTSNFASNSLAVPVHYVPPNPIDPLTVCTRDDFVAWMPIEWRLSEIPARSRPGHVVLPEVRAVLARWAVDDLDEVTRREALQAGSIARNTVAAALRTIILDRPSPAPVVTYVSCLDELPVQGEEHRLYCIYGYEAAYVYQPGANRPYRPTNLSAAAVAEWYADGATLERVPSALPTGIMVVFNNYYRGPVGWRTDDQGSFCCQGRLFIGRDRMHRCDPLLGRRDNTADHAFTLPAGTAIPTRAIQGDPVEVTIPRLTPEQLDDMHTWSRVAEARGVVLPSGFNTTRAATASSSFPHLSAENAPTQFFLPRRSAATPAAFVPEILPVTAGPRRIMRLPS